MRVEYFRAWSAQPTINSHDAKQPEVESLLLECYGIENLLWRRNAIFQAKSIINSQRELLALHIQELNWKIRSPEEDG